MTSPDQQSPVRLQPVVSMTGLLEQTRQLLTERGWARVPGIGWMHKDSPHRGVTMATAMMEEADKEQAQGHANAKLRDAGESGVEQT